MAISDNLRGVIYMNVAMLAFTVNDSFMKAVTQDLPLFQAISMRGVLTTLALLGIAMATGGLRLWPAPRDRSIILIRSLAEIGGTVLFLAALVHMELANLSAILQSLPLAVTLAAAVFFGDKVGWRRMLAIVIGFIGVLIIIRPGADAFDIWSVMGLGSVACVVVRDLATRELSRDVPSTTVAVWAAISVTVMGLLVSVPAGWEPVEPRQFGLIAAASGALIIGYMFVVMVMRVGDIGLIAPFRYTALIWAILLGWLMFGTLPDSWTLVGAGIVVATGLFTLLRERQVRRASAGLKA